MLGIDRMDHAGTPRQTGAHMVTRGRALTRLARSIGMPVMASLLALALTPRPAIAQTVEFLDIDGVTWTDASDANNLADGWAQFTLTGEVKEFTGPSSQLSQSITFYKRNLILRDERIPWADSAVDFGRLQIYNLQTEEWQTFWTGSESFSANYLIESAGLDGNLRGPVDFRWSPPDSTAISGDLPYIVYFEVEQFAPLDALDPLSPFRRADFRSDNLRIENINLPPEFGSSGFTLAAEELALPVSLAGLASDPNGDRVTFRSLAGPDRNLFALSPEGLLTYVGEGVAEDEPDAEGARTYDLRFTLDDGNRGVTTVDFLLTAEVSDWPPADESGDSDAPSGTGSDDGDVEDPMEVVGDLDFEGSVASRGSAQFDHVMAEDRTLLLDLFHVTGSFWVQVRDESGMVVGMGVATGEGAGDSNLAEAVAPGVVQVVTVDGQPRFQIELAGNAGERFEIEVQETDGSSASFRLRHPESGGGVGDGQVQFVEIDEGFALDTTLPQGEPQFFTHTKPDDDPFLLDLFHVSGDIQVYVWGDDGMLIGTGGAYGDAASALGVVQFAPFPRPYDLQIDLSGQTGDRFEIEIMPTSEAPASFRMEQADVPGAGDGDDQPDQNTGEAGTLVDLTEDVFMTTRPARSDFVIQPGGNTISGASEILLEMQHSGSVSAEFDPRDIFYFTAELDGRVFVDVEEIFGNQVSVAVYEDPDLGPVEWELETHFAKLDFEVEEGERYYIEITPPTDELVEYLFSTQFLESENSDPFDPTLLPRDDMHVESVGYGGDSEDWYQIAPSGDGTVVVTMTGVSEHLNVDVFEDGDRLSLPRNIEPGKPTQIEFEAQANEVYDVRVTPFGGSASVYRIEWERDEQPGGFTSPEDVDAMPLLTGSYFDGEYLFQYGELSADTTAMSFTADLDSGQHLLSVAGQTLPSASQDLPFSITSADGTVVASGDTAEIFTADGGTYTINVSLESDASTAIDRPFFLSLVDITNLDRNVVFFPGSTLEAGQEVANVIDGQTDSFTVSLEAGTQYVFDMRATEGSRLDSTLRLSQDDELVEGSFAEGDVSVVYTPEQSGEYTLEAGGWRSPFGGYLLSMEEFPQESTPPEDGEFHVSTERFPVDQDYNAEAKSLFGEDFELAEWRDVKQRYEREGGRFLRDAGLVMRDEDGPSSAAVTVAGQRFHAGGQRHYFVAWGEVPSSFLVHERAVYQGVPLNLGSWHSDQRILAVAPDGSTPSSGAQVSVTRNMLDALRRGLTCAGFDEGATAINFASSAAEISVAVGQRDPDAVREALADAVVSFMPVAMRGSTSVLGVISEPVLVDGELKVKVNLPFRFLRTGDPRALDCGDNNPECSF